MLITSVPLQRGCNSLGTIVLVVPMRKACHGKCFFRVVHCLRHEDRYGRIDQVPGIRLVVFWPRAPRTAPSSCTTTLTASARLTQHCNITTRSQLFAPYKECAACSPRNCREHVLKRFKHAVTDAARTTHTSLRGELPHTAASEPHMKPFG